jgi:hypothetical protein
MICEKGLGVRIPPSPPSSPQFSRSPLNYLTTGYMPDRPHRKILPAPTCLQYLPGALVDPSLII